MASAPDRARQARLRVDRVGDARRWALDARARPVPPGDERPGHLRVRRRALRPGEARGGRSRRGQHGDRLRAPVPQERRRGGRRSSGRARSSTVLDRVRVQKPGDAGPLGSLSCPFSLRCLRRVDRRHARGVGWDGRGPEPRRGAMSSQQGDRFSGGVTRRRFIKGTGAVAILGGSLYATAPAAARARRLAQADTPIGQVMISCAENRSFDHYFGYAPQVQAAGFGPPSGYSQPDAAGNPHYPFEFSSLTTPDPPHSWNAVHEQWNGGAMDGFYKSSAARIGDGDAAIGYYTAAELPFYYSLLDDSALVGNFFCSLLGPTWPNRFYMAAGTSGGITTNGVWGYGVFDYPIILDLLDAAGVSWKVYNLGWDSVPYGNTDNVFVFWKRYANDMRTLGS